MRLPRLASLILILAWLPSCASEPTGCATGGECGPGMACDAPSGQCLPVADRAPALEVTPPTNNNQGWVTQEFPTPPLDPDGRIVIQLAPAVALQGQVVASEAPGKVVPATIVTWRDSLIEGRDRLQAEARQTLGGKSDAPVDNKFELWLAKGHTYSVLVSPAAPFDEVYPPLYIPTLELKDHLARDFVLDGTDRAVKVEGRIRDYGGAVLSAQGLTDEKGNKLVSSLRVSAVEESGARRSTVGATLEKDGSFSLRVPPGIAKYTLSVSSRGGGVPIPSMECEEVVMGLAEPGDPPTQKLKELRLPSFRFPRLYAVSVRGEDGTPVVGAQVTFSTETPVLPTSQSNCSARYSRTGHTGADGKAALLLLPGSAKENQTYEVSVTSPATSPHASRFIKKLDVGPPNGPKTVLAPISLSRRYSLTGTVVRADDGSPVEAVVIEATGVAPGQSGKTPVGAANANATTAADGTFELHVDDGTYNIHLKPPPGSGLPAYGQTTKVEGDVKGARFEIPSPTVLTGQVLDPGGQRIKDATVRVFELVPVTAKPVTNKAALRGSAVTRADGSFNLILPARGPATR